MVPRNSWLGIDIRAVSWLTISRRPVMSRLGITVILSSAFAEFFVSASVSRVCRSLDVCLRLSPLVGSLCHPTDD